MANIFSTAGKFASTTVEEGKKVLWPSRDLIVRHTVTVIATIAVFAAIFAAVDYGFQQLVLLALKR